MEEVNRDEMIQRDVEEFSRLQTYMSLTEKDTTVYKAMRTRYIELKVILTAIGVNLTQLDIIQE